MAHKKSNIKDINRFTATKELVLAGVSRDKKKFGHMVFKDLLKKGYDVYPVNPNIDKIDGVQCYPSIEKVPGNCKKVLLTSPADASEDLVGQCIKRGVEAIWFQKGSATGQAIDTARKNGINTIEDQCIFMFLEPVQGVHKFHRFLVKLFGTYPK